VLRSESGSEEEAHGFIGPAAVERLAGARIRGTSYLLAGFRGGVEVLNRATRKSVISYRGGDNDRTMAVGIGEGEKGAVVAAVRFPSTIEVFDLNRPGPPRIAGVPRQLVYAAAFTQLDKKLVLVAGGDGGWIQMLDPITAKPLSRQLGCGDSVETLAITVWPEAPVALVASTSRSLMKIEVCGWDLLTKRKVADKIHWTGTATALAGGMLFGEPVIVLGTDQGIALFRSDGRRVGEVQLDAAVIDIVFDEPARIIVATTKGIVALDWLG
jgi:hypothetical protein